MTGRHGSTRARDSHRAAGRARRTPARTLAAGRWRRLTGAASATALAFGLLACACSLVAVAGPRTSTQLRTKAWDQMVAQTPAADKTVLGTLDAGTLTAAVNGPITPAVLAEQKATLRRHLSAHLPLAAPSTDWAGLTTPFSRFTDHAKGVGTDTTLLELAYRDSLPGNVRVLAGSLPTRVISQGSTAIVQAAVTTATAERFGLSVGSRVSLGGAGIVLAVTAIVTPAKSGSSFWQVDPIVAAPVLVAPAMGEPYWQGGALVPASAVNALQARFDASNIQLTWQFGAAPGRLTAQQAVTLATDLPSVLPAAGQLVLSSFRYVAAVSLTSGLVTVLQTFASQDGAVSNVLDLMSVSLAVVAATVVLLAAWLMADKRREELGMLRARGASRRQLAVTALVGSAIAAVPGTSAGVGAAIALTPGARSSLAWYLAGLVAATALAGPVVITIRMHRGYASVGRPDQAAGRMSTARRLVVEGGLVLGSVGGLIVLHDQGLGPSGDLYASAAPVLAAIPVAIITLRLYPAFVRLLLRLAARRAGVTVFLGLARAVRVSATAVLPAFAMVLALSLVSFAGMVRGAVNRGEIAQSWQATGADAVISLPGPLTGAQERAVAAAPGVLRAVPVALTTAPAVTGSALTVAFVDPTAYAALLAATPLGSVPASFASWRGGVAEAGQHGVVPALGSPEVAAELGHKAVVLTLADAQRIRIRLAGVGPAMSQVQTIGGPNFGGYVLLPRSALGTNALPPSQLLVVGSAVDGAALAAAVRSWHVRGAVVTLRSAFLAELERAPLARDAYAELAVGGVAAAVGCMLVLLLTLMLSAQSRQLTLARANTMGMSMAQARWLALVEALPQILSVVIGGLACALVLVPVIGPALVLSVFTGSATSVAVRIEPVWLALAAGALLILAIATLAAQTVLASYRTPRSLRIGG
jgi:putative ABC transport system permease protein